jgi:peptidoglycan/LPS O-acetylase OafA/YrhL
VALKEYRSEIDGLRAVAVLAVVLYHAEFVLNSITLFSGGFIGVDIFFVISGYLITSIILSELKKDDFTFIRFYERRMRRILPALFFVIIFSVVMAYNVMTPKAMKEYAESVIFSQFFLSNIFFWLEDSYVAEPSKLKPFLHTWSLSVEEQFYIIMPVFLVVMWKYLKSYIAAVFVLGFISSLLFAEYYWGKDPDAVFYLLPSRAWELLAGSFLAKLQLDMGKREGRGWFDKIMPSVGLLLIVLSIACFDISTQHPSIYTVIPVVGVMLILWFSREGELVAFILSSWPLRAIGLISYSFYLWHWVIFSLSRIQDNTFTNADRMMQLTCALIAAVITYFFVEKPFRNQRKVHYKINTLVFGWVLISVVFAGVIWTDGLLFRLDSLYSKEAKALNEYNNSKLSVDTAMNNAQNLFEDQRPAILIIGDSYYHAWSVALSEYIDLDRYRVVTLRHSECGPIWNGVEFVMISTGVIHPAHKEHCTNFYRYINDESFLSKVTDVIYVGLRPEVGDGASRVSIMTSLKNRFDGMKIYVFGNYFQMDHKKSCLQEMQENMTSAKVCLDMAEYPSEVLTFRGNYSAEFIDVIGLGCGYVREECPYEAYGVPFISDWHHLNTTFLIEYLGDVFSGKNEAYFEKIGFSRLLEAI